VSSAFGMQAKAKAVVRRQMKHVLFTEPAEIEAGQNVTIYYSPQDTPLSGTQEVYLTVSPRHFTYFSPLSECSWKEVRAQPGVSLCVCVCVCVCARARARAWLCEVIPDRPAVVHREAGTGGLTQRKLVL
jgi:hypothetical protein